MNSEFNPETKPNKITWQKYGILLLSLLIGLVIAYFTFKSVSAFVSTWDITSLPGLALSGDPTPTLQEGEALVDIEPTVPAPIAPAAPTPEPWDGGSRVTILVMGLDYREWVPGEGPPRTDTMILLTIDPLSKTAGILSIPRDLWVRIPNFDYGKINTAYQLGEAWNLPGGGPELARETAENLIGVPIHYYAQIDFSAFIRFIDEIGGVKIDNPKKIRIDLLDDKEGFKKLIPEGVIALSGEYALAYVRARNSQGGDFDRALRQQLVIFGIRDRITHYSLLPTLLSKAPVLYGELASGINTNLGLEEAFQLAFLAQQIPDENIFQGAIGTEHVAFAKSPDDLDILKPLPDKIRLLRDQIFNSNELFSPVASEGGNPLDLAISENASIKLLNGTFTPGLAGRTGEYLQSLDLNVQVLADADDKPQPFTSIYDYTGNPYALKYFVELMGISEFRIFQRFSPESEVDVAIIIGDEWIWNNPMP